MMKQSLEKALTKSAEHFAKQSAKSACVTWFYQPALPDKVAALKNVK